MADGRGSHQLSLPLSGPAGLDGGFDYPVRDGSNLRDERGGAIRCRQCGQAVDLPAWLRRLGVERAYCGQACRRAWVESGPDFEVRLGGGRRRGANWAVQVCRARERDRFTCQECGVTEEELGRRLHVHHRIPYRRFRSNVEANKLEHLVCLCPACHGRQEAQLRRQLPLFAST